MTDQPSEEQVSKPRELTPYWITMFVLTIATGVALLLFSDMPIEIVIASVIFALILEITAYYGRIKTSITLNRGMYILSGLPVGFVLWYIACLLFSRIMTDLTFFVLSLVVCISIGVLIGDCIGRLRNYKGPEQYQP